MPIKTITDKQAILALQLLRFSKKYEANEFPIRIKKLADIFARSSKTMRRRLDALNEAGYIDLKIIKDFAIVQINEKLKKRFSKTYQKKDFQPA